MAKISKIVVFSIALLMLINQTAFADNRHGSGKSHKKSHKFSSHPVYKSKPRYQTRKPSSRFPGRSHDYYRPGYRTHYLPKGYKRVFFGNLEYFFFDGFFYRPYHNEYRIVDGPIGAIVLSLPRLHFTLQWNGLDYFRAGNTYYRPHPRGYIVVRNPGFRGRW